jgi:hypothetical protein
MARYLALLLLFYCNVLSAQDTLKITRTFVGSDRVQKVFSVLASDTTILHGAYVTYHANGRVLQTGCYSFGQRDGEWKSWFDNGNKETETFYTRGRESGVWSYYAYDGAPSCAFNMDSISAKTAAAESNRHYTMEMIYPEKARDLEIEGDVEAAVLMDSTCHVIGFSILSYSDEIFRTAVLAQLNSNKNYFQKIASGSQPCLPLYKIPFRFRLNH